MMMVMINNNHNINDHKSNSRNMSRIGLIMITL